MIPASTIWSATSWAAAAGVAMTPMATPCSRTICVEVVEGADVDAGDDLAVPLRVGVEQGDDAEAAAAEAGVVGQRVAEVADADDDDGPVLGHADLAGDLVAQVVDVVPDAAGAVAAEVGEVLAELGAVDAGGGGELLARAGGGAALGQRGERPQVDGQSGHGRLGDVPGAVAGRALPVAATAPSLQPRTGAIEASATPAASPTLGVCERENKPRQRWHPTRLRPGRSWHPIGGDRSVSFQAANAAEADRTASYAERRQRSRSGLVDPPEVVLAPVDEGHRDLLAVRARCSVRVVGDRRPRRSDSPSSAQTRSTTARASSHRWQPGLGVERDPGGHVAHSSSPSARRRSMAAQPALLAPCR